jgi:hypothetical protein
LVDPLLRAAIAVLVLGVAAIAFAVSFEAIRAFAISSGAFPPALGWCAPLLVDSFTAATTLVILSRARAGLPAHYAWTLLACATGVSVALNVAHAPQRLAARLVAALPPLAQLAAVELGMSEARRTLPRVRSAPSHRPARKASAPSRPTSPAAASRVRPHRAAGARRRDGSRERVRALVAHERQTGVRLTGVQVAAQLGLKPRRAQELLRELRAGLDAPPDLSVPVSPPTDPAEGGTS